MQSGAKSTDIETIIADLAAKTATSCNAATQLFKDADRLHKRTGRIHTAADRLHRKVEQTHSRVRMYRARDRMHGRQYLRRTGRDLESR